LNDAIYPDGYDFYKTDLTGDEIAFRGNILLMFFSFSMPAKSISSFYIRRDRIYRSLKLSPNPCDKCWNSNKNPPCERLIKNLISSAMICYMIDIPIILPCHRLKKKENKLLRRIKKECRELRDNNLVSFDKIIDSE